MQRRVLVAAGASAIRTLRSRQAGAPRAMAPDQPCAAAGLVRDASFGALDAAAGTPLALDATR